MLKKMALLIVAASFLLIVTVPIHSHGIEPQVQHGGA